MLLRTNTQHFSNFTVYESFCLMLILIQQVFPELVILHFQQAPSDYEKWQKEEKKREKKKKEKEKWLAGGLHLE